MSKHIHTILKIKLGPPIGMRQKTLDSMLDRVGHGCDMARNAMIRWWEIRRREDGWLPDPLLKKSGEPKLARSGEPWLKNQLGPEKNPGTDTCMYHFARTVVPWINSNLIASCSRAVASDLKDRMPWDSDAHSVYVWQAILAYERQPQAYRRRQIPVPNNNVKLSWDSQCTIELPLLSKQDESGLPRRVAISLRTQRMRKGHKRLIKKCIDGDIKLSDSFLVKKGRCWFLHANIMQEATSCVLDKSRTVTLLPNTEDIRRPFTMIFPDGNSFDLGAGQQVEAEYKRVLSRQRSIRYWSRSGVGRGRGKRRFYEKLRPMNRRFKAIQDTFCCMLADDLVKQCLDDEAGKIVYRQPSRYVRRLCWFERRGVPFDWTALHTRLQHRCLRAGIELITEDLKKEEWEKRVS